VTFEVKLSSYIWFCKTHTHTMLSYIHMKCEFGSTHLTHWVGRLQLDQERSQNSIIEGAETSSIKIISKYSFFMNSKQRYFTNGPIEPYI
jgi:hypothetical protein